MSVLADGCFDPLHWGHVRYLEAAAAYGPLTVRVALDVEIEDKGRRPFQTRAERIAMVGALRCVAAVTDHATLARAVYALRPVYLVKGPGWRGRIPDLVRKACEATATQIVFTDTQERTSTERLDDCRSI